MAGSPALPRSYLAWAALATALLVMDVAASVVLSFYPNVADWVSIFAVEDGVFYLGDEVSGYILLSVLRCAAFSGLVASLSSTLKRFLRERRARSGDFRESDALLSGVSLGDASAFDPAAQDLSQSLLEDGAAPPLERMRDEIREAIGTWRKWQGRTLTLSIVVTAAKLLARLIQGVRPHHPADMAFWWAVTLTGVARSAAEAVAARRLVASANALDPDKAAEEERRAKRDMARWRDIWLLCLPDWPLFLIAFAALSIAAAGETVVPLFLGKMIDAIAIEEDSGKFDRLMLYLVVTAAVTGLFTGVRGSTFMIVGARFGVRVRQKLFDALLLQDAEFFERHKTGDVISRISADTQKVSEQIELNINVALRSVLQAAFTLIAMTVISWQLSVTAFVSVPLVVVISKSFGGYVRKLAKTTQSALADASSVAEEALSSIATVKAFSAEDAESRRFSGKLRRFLATTHYQAIAYAAYAATSYTFLPQASYCLVLYYGGKLNARGEVGSGDLVSFVFYLQSLFAAFNSMGNIYTGLLQAAGAAEKVFEWIELEPSLRPPEDGGRRLGGAETSGEVALRDVSFSYPTRPDKRVLDGLSLGAAPGEVVALCGPSGSGKSSCIALIQRLYAADKGAVTLDGTCVSQLNPKSFRRFVSIVSQEPVLFARTIQENILFGIQDPQDRPLGEADADALPVDPAIVGHWLGLPLSPPGDGSAAKWRKTHDAAVMSDILQEDAEPDAAAPRLEGVSPAVVRAAKLANCHDFIMGFPEGYHTMVGERGASLSGGQKQRVAIARALVRQPTVLLLDEATSALDAESERIVQDAIDKLISEKNRTCMLIAHRLSTIRNADRIFFIDAGRVRETGTFEELMARRGAFFDLVQKQTHGMADGAAE